ncbi:MAG: methylated-DNA--[protein]-cysteine S-methyltransferase [Thermoflexales bacterium]|nr:methylated-DNA--[protein]-cysteine S-methyltransferase [Thermoflexales bacterium]
MDYSQSSQDYARIEQAIRFLEGNVHTQPSLGEIAASASLSEYHFQRLFTRWVGISPKRFLQFLTKEHAKALLEKSRPLLEVSYESGLSGPSRLHELFVTCEAVTPGEFKNKGRGLTIAYGFHPSPFGECLLGLTGRGICHLAFVSGSRELAVEDLQSRWPRAKLAQDAERTGRLAQQAFTRFERSGDTPLSLFLSGTNFQLKVWEALLEIPPGALSSYQDIAARLGLPAAARAVGNAVGQNPISVLIPCHRVIQKTGQVGNYRWGTARKKALVGWEAVLTINS